jgi:uncharacterized protein YxjI
LIAIGAAAVAMRLGREALGAAFGWVGALIGAAVFIGAIVAWRLTVRNRARRNGVAEYTPEMIQKQLAGSGAGVAAFEEDGSLLGASIMVVNQRSKLIEVITEYEIFGSNGALLGRVQQIGQGAFKRFLRFVTVLDQYMTHHFEITAPDGVMVLRVTRPRKLFKSRLEVFDGNNQFLGRIVQNKVFGKINFGIYDPAGQHLATLQAENWRAWDFRVDSPSGVELARVTKTWEGLARTLFTSADTYVVRVHHRLGDPLRQLVAAVALTVDVALKQDPRGLGAG